VGIYDREYYRRERPGVYFSAPRTVVAYLIVINVVLWLANSLLTPDTHAITLALAATGETLTRPWLWWQFLTYGFVHAPELWHLLFNMLGLFFFGREVEVLYGRKEFLRIYLVTIVLGGLVWGLMSWLTARPGVQDILYGASGAVVAVIILFVLHYPRQTVYLYFVPVPAWVLGIIVVGSDVYRWVMTPDTNVAYMVHLTGAAFALAYFYFHWNLGNWLPSGWPVRRSVPGPKLRLHDPQVDQQRLSEEVDRILEKISREGEDSLTRKERRTLENASRQYQKRRHGDD
jgi:membrane associated rhomboid family serine protease